MARIWYRPTYTHWGRVDPYYVQDDTGTTRVSPGPQETDASYQHYQGMQEHPKRHPLQTEDDEVTRPYDASDPNFIEKHVRSREGDALVRLPDTTETRAQAAKRLHFATQHPAQYKGEMT